MVVSERYLKNGEQFMVRVCEGFVHGAHLSFVDVRNAAKPLYIELQKIEDIFKRQITRLHVYLWFVLGEKGR
jgi:hypothetical protein